MAQLRLRISPAVIAVVVVVTIAGLGTPSHCQSTNFLQHFLDTADDLLHNNRSTSVISADCAADLQLINSATHQHSIWATKCECHADTHWSRSLDRRAVGDWTVVVVAFKCCDLRTQIMILIRGYCYIYSFAVMDASGRIDAAFVYGNNFWLGSKSSCARVSDPHPIRVDNRYPRYTLPNLTDIVAPISITYRMVYAKHQSPLQFDPKLYDKVSSRESGDRLRLVWIKRVRKLMDIEIELEMLSDRLITIMRWPRRAFFNY